jgi:hypothetical protein
MTQSWLGRLLGYATVRIESANEASGLGVISDLRQPLLFYGPSRRWWRPRRQDGPVLDALGPPQQQSSDAVLND